MADKEILLRIGTCLRDLRTERGLTQEALGEKSGYHFSYYIGQIERGEKNVALLNLAKIAEALEVDISQLWSDGTCRPASE